MKNTVREKIKELVEINEESSFTQISEENKIKLIAAAFNDDEFCAFDEICDIDMGIENIFIDLITGKIKPEIFRNMIIKHLFLTYIDRFNNIFDEYFESYIKSVHINCTDEYNPT